MGEVEQTAEETGDWNMKEQEVPAGHTCMRGRGWNSRVQQAVMAREGGFDTDYRTAVDCQREVWIVEWKCGGA